MSQRRGGIIQIAANGVVYDAKGDFTVNYGRPLREAIIGADKPHGYMETPQVPSIEGAITDRGDLSLDDLFTMEDATITLQLANGKMVALNKAYYAGEGTVTTQEGEVAVKWNGDTLEEVPA